MAVDGNWELEADRVDPVGNGMQMGPGGDGNEAGEGDGDEAGEGGGGGEEGDGDEAAGEEESDEKEEHEDRDKVLLEAEIRKIRRHLQTLPDLKDALDSVINQVPNNPNRVYPYF